MDYIGEWAFGDRDGVKKIVFKKVPKKLANGYIDKFIHERSDYPRENYDERIHIEARQNQNSMTFYVPATTKMLDIEVNVPATVHFASPTPPRYNTYKIIDNSTIYVPKGSMTAYYSAFGNSNKYIEE